jgi:hypothetical protein
MRCPHCASPRASPPVCLSCGLPVDAPSEQPIVPGLEPTRAAPIPTPPPQTVPGLEPTRQPVMEVAVLKAADVIPTRAFVPEVSVEPLSGLETNEDVLGDAPVAGEPGVDLTRCPHCNARSAHPRLCDQCGRLIGPARAESEPPPPTVCSECGVPNPAARTKCLACGKRL